MFVSLCTRLSPNLLVSERHIQNIEISSSNSTGNLKEENTNRIIWPVAISYFETVRVIVAWCEMRHSFRNFRTDRVVDAQFLSDRYPTPRVRLLVAWKKQMKKEHEEMMARRAAQLPPGARTRSSREHPYKARRV